MKTCRLPEKAGVQWIAGVLPQARPLLILDAALQARSPVSVIFLPTRALARTLRGQLSPFLSIASRKSGDELSAVFLPAPPETVSSDEPLPERLLEDLACDRLAALASLKEARSWRGGRQQLLLLTTPDAFTAPVPPPDDLAALEVHLKAGDTVDFNDLQKQLVEVLDYDAEAICERPGQFAVRGGLIDVYPLNGDAPVRLDFFGDELESIRRFDPTTQRSLDTLPEVAISPRQLATIGHSQTTLLDWLGKKVHWLFLEPAEMEEAYHSFFTTFERIEDQRFNLDRLYRERHDNADRWTGLQELETQPPFFEQAQPSLSLATVSLSHWRDQPLQATIGLERLEEETRTRKHFLEQLAEWSGEGSTRLFSLIANTGKSGEIERLINDTLPEGLPLETLPAELPEGWRLEERPAGWFKWLQSRGKGPLVFVTEHEWLGRHSDRKPVHRQRLLPHRTRVDALLDFSELADGDYLVHLSHGICRYRGLRKMDFKERTDDVISVEFADQVTLHVPLQEAHLLTRYVGLTRTAPRLGKLGSSTWEKARAAAETATLDFAADMLNLQARREEGDGIAFTPDTEWQQAFENAFPHNETPDQLEAIETTKEDMERPRPMDRLVCGDVGFGKTEVAIRAAFKAVMDGYQVAIMVPTTVLAQQHFDTFRERFAPYPLTVEMLSRFRNSAQQKEIIQQMAAGAIDVVIGTHRLLSKDIRFARLGLLVIDEEHRFGVRHKERLKHYKSEVDVLSMSATPIPRTLYLALAGARDLSVIETPPADRLPIETLVRSYDPQLVRKAIEHELERGGQVFYLHNRVQTIHSVAARISELVPKASIEIGHGQMSELQLERVMTRFVAGKTDILVCTTIIENGLDIPNCNTIIIEGADRFGLSQLYQLRGRVGRFKRQAYAYLLLHRHTHMLDTARKRLSAMRQYNQLGAGFRIAMRDLELRGAGNLLGHQQSGHIATIGFDLYCQLLRQSIERLKGKPTASHIRATVALDFISGSRTGTASGKRSETGFTALLEDELEATRIAPVDATFPQKYLTEARLRIDFYRQLAMAESLEVIEGIAEALSDRFGKPPPPVKRLLALTRIRVRAEMAGIRLVESEGNRLKCLRASGKRGDFIKRTGRFPRLTGKTADLRLRDIERILTAFCHNHAE